MNRPDDYALGLLIGAEMGRAANERLTAAACMALRSRVPETYDEIKARWTACTFNTSIERAREMIAERRAAEAAEAAR